MLCEISDNNSTNEDSGQNSSSQINVPLDFELNVDDENDFYSLDEGDFEDVFDFEEEMEEITDVGNLKKWAIECNTPQISTNYLQY